jgi:hypothetical protein
MDGPFRERQNVQNARFYAKSSKREIYEERLHPLCPPDTDFDDMSVPLILEETSDIAAYCVVYSY